MAAGLNQGVFENELAISRAVEGTSSIREVLLNSTGQSSAFVTPRSPFEPGWRLHVPVAEQVDAQR